MSQRYDRRTFLRRVGAAGLVAPALPLVGCAGDGGPRPEDPDTVGSAAPPSVVERPVLLALSDDAIRVAAPAPELPMAYVSLASRRVFVDYAYRDRSRWILDAHISVSTGLWRIPLPGDPEGLMIPPGNVPREFEELDISAWDPTAEPAAGDFRVRRGRPVPVRIEFSCVPVAATGGWYSAGPLDVLRCDGSGDEACREDLMEVGRGAHHPVRGCGDAPREVRVFSWACRV